MWFVLGVLALPLIEIALFVTIGAEIGLWATLAWVVLSALIGFAVIRGQGARAVYDVRLATAELRDPTGPIARSAFGVIAGVLLILPGFFTDALGILLLLPPVQAALRRFVASRVRVQTFATRSQGGPGVIDGEFQEIEPGNLPPRGPSGWTRH